MKKNHIGIIKDIKELNKNVYSLSFFSETIDNILPGEYISILCEGLTLRRPFSVANFENNTVTILIKKRGKGTEYLSSLKVGDRVEFSAPLGNTFKIENKKTLLIGAGIGVAPLFYLNKKSKEIGAETYFAAGFLNESDVLRDVVELGSVDNVVGQECPTYGENSDSRSGIPARQQKDMLLESFDFVSTDDGSNGNKGSICDYLEQLIKDFKPEKIVSCAPHPVLKFISEIANKHNIECEVAMEKVMACGIGVCRGCVIQIKKDDIIQNATVCKDGPVFNAAEVVW